MQPVHQIVSPKTLQASRGSHTSHVSLLCTCAFSNVIKIYSSSQTEEVSINNVCQLSSVWMMGKKKQTYYSENFIKNRNVCTLAADFHKTPTTEKQWIHFSLQMSIARDLFWSFLGRTTWKHCYNKANICRLSPSLFIKSKFFILATKALHEVIFNQTSLLRVIAKKYIFFSVVLEKKCSSKWQTPWKSSAPALYWRGKTQG